MAHTQQTYPQQMYNNVPGLDEKPPSSYTNGPGPNCDACTEIYFEGPLFSSCETCMEGFENMLMIEALFARNPDEDSLPLRTDPAGGLFLKLA